MKPVFTNPAIAFAIFVTLAVPAAALPKPHAAANVSGPLTCPVTKLMIPSPAAAVGKSVYKGKTYFFCTAQCKRLFDKNPRKYAK